MPPIGYYPTGPAHLIWNKWNNMSNLRDSAKPYQKLTNFYDLQLDLYANRIVAVTGIHMPNTPSAAAMAAAERLCRTMSSKSFSGSGDSGDVDVTVSIGLVTGVAGELSLEELIRLADEALYEAKNTGRNRVVVANTGISQAPNQTPEPQPARSSAG